MQIERVFRDSVAGKWIVRSGERLYQVHLRMVPGRSTEWTVEVNIKPRYHGVVNHFRRIQGRWIINAVREWENSQSLSV